MNKNNREMLCNLIGYTAIISFEYPNVVFPEVQKIKSVFLSYNLLIW